MADTDGIINAAIHPSTTPASYMHNFAPIYAPESSLARSTGYNWWAITGVDGYGVSTSAGDVAVFKSRNGVDWVKANLAFSGADVHYSEWDAHSYFDGARISGPCCLCSPA